MGAVEGKSSSSRDFTTGATHLGHRCCCLLSNNGGSRVNVRCFFDVAFSSWLSGIDVSFMWVQIFKSPPDEPDQPDGDDCVQDVVVGSKVVQSSLLTNPSTALHNHIPCSPAPDTPGQQIRRQTRTIYANQAALSHPSQVGRSRPVHMFNMKTRGLSNDFCSLYC